MRIFWLGGGDLGVVNLAVLACVRRQYNVVNFFEEKKCTPAEKILATPFRNQKHRSIVRRRKYFDILSRLGRVIHEFDAQMSRQQMPRFMLRCAAKNTIRQAPLKCLDTRKHHRPNSYETEFTWVEVDK